MSHKLDKINEEMAQLEGPMEITVSGQTLVQTSEEFKQEFLEPQNRWCYLCHRKEGAPGICFTKGEVDYYTIELRPFEIECAGLFKLKYHFCFECFALLTSLGVLNKQPTE